MTGGEPISETLRFQGKIVSMNAVEISARNLDFPLSPGTLNYLVVYRIDFVTHQAL
jgi:hypothetical protein